MPKCDQRREKLRHAKERFEEINADLIQLLKELQEYRDPNRPEKSLTADDCPWILQIAEQRNVLRTIVGIIDEAIGDIESSE